MANVNWGGVEEVAAVFLIPTALLLAGRAVLDALRRRKAGNRPQDDRDPLLLAKARRRHPSSRKDRHGKSLSRRERCEWERITGALPDLAELENKS